ncbi:RNase P/RNase MRP complex subunit [Podochytrium sp. JEL0797]|nr:RNase P/RNase MRP complex subunit [Podochytrium sp. JEL0797]
MATPPPLPTTATTGKAVPLESTLYAPLSSTFATSTSDSAAFAPKDLFLAPSAPGSVASGFKALATYDDKLKGRQAHLDNPVKDAGLREAARRERNQKTKGMIGKRPRRKKLLTRKEKDELGDVGAKALGKTANLTYAMFIPLHKLWRQYMTELFSDTPNAQYSSEASLIKILKADFHGSVFTVTHSKCKHNIGVSGIMIKETENMFYIMTRENEVKGIPKNKSNFAFAYDSQLFTLYGCNLKGTASDRVTKKLRWKNTIEIV